MIFEYKNKKLININDIYRNKIISYWTKYEDELFSDNEMIDALSYILQSFDYNIAINYFSVMFVDTYKLLNYKFKCGNISASELSMFQFLKEVTHEGIEVYMDYEGNTFRFICEYFKKFCDLNEFYKRICFLNTDAHSNVIMQLISPYHTLDLKKYASEIKTEQYLSISKNILNSAEDNIFINWDMIDDYLINSIVSFMKELYIMRPNNFETNFNDMIRVSYSYSKYLVDHTKRNINGSYEKEIVTTTENDSIIDIKQYAINNRKFLEKIIKLYLDYGSASITSGYLDEDEEVVPFDNNDVKKYSKNFSDKVKKRLGIE